MNKLVDQIDFVLAQTQEDRESVYILRENNYRDDSDFLLHTTDSDFAGEDTFDDCSHLFGLKMDGEVIATCRLTPFNDGYWALKGLLEREQLHFTEVEYVHFNRILVDRRFRNRRIHDLMFLGVSHWGLKYNQMRYFFAICQVPYLRYYARYGVTRIDETPLVLPQREEAYHLIEGCFESTYILLRNRLIDAECLPSKYPPVTELRQQGDITDGIL